MRISDWSSDVCSSYLSLLRQRPLRRVDRPETAVQAALLHARQVDLGIVAMNPMLVLDRPAGQVERGGRVEMAVERQQPLVERSEERSGGKECVRTCRSRWWPDH